MKLIRTIAFLMLLSAATAAAAQSLEANLRRHINYLCSPALEGRLAGSEGERQAASYLYDRLEEIGITMLTDRAGDTFTIITATGDTIASRNIVGIIEGSDPNLREEYIVIGAHLDHLGYYTVNIDGVPQKRIYPGADSDASGVAALTEVARIVAGNQEALRRSVLFVGFGAMEQEFSGSRYFACDGGFSHIGNVKMMINLDMLGRGNASNPFEIYSAISPKVLQRMMNMVLEKESVTARAALHNGVVFPSDNLAFKQADIPNLTFSTGISAEYRTVRDTPDLLLYDNLAAETVYIAAFLTTVNGMDNLYAEKDAKDERVYSLGDCDVQPKFFREPARNFLEKWVYKYLKYPQEALSDGVEGFERVTNKRGEPSFRAVVNVSFIVEADGNVSNVTVEKGVNELLDAEALRVVEASPKWTPGTIDGKKVRVRIVIPVEFRLKQR